MAQGIGGKTRDLRQLMTGASGPLVAPQLAFTHAHVRSRATRGRCQMPRRDAVPAANRGAWPAMPAGLGKLVQIFLYPRRQHDGRKLTPPKIRWGSCRKFCAASC